MPYKNIINFNLAIVEKRLALFLAIQTLIAGVSDYMVNLFRKLKGL